MRTTASPLNRMLPGSLAERHGGDIIDDRTYCISSVQTSNGPMMPPTISHTDAPFWLDRSLPAKRHPEVLLEPADLLTERRLGDPEPGDRLRDAQLVSHHDKVSELSQLHARESYQAQLSLAEPRRDWTPQGRHSIVDEPIAELELDTITAWQTELPGVAVVPAGPDIYEVTVPPALDGGHETHLARVLDEFLRIVDDRRWPTALAERTVAKYTLLTAAAARTLGST